MRGNRASRRRSLSPLGTAVEVRSHRRHLNHADRRGPALAARLHSRRPAFGGAAECACAMPRTQQSRRAQRDEYIARMMRKQNRARLTADVALLLSSGMRLLVRHGRNRTTGACTTSSEERRLVPTHNVGAGGTRSAGGPFAAEAATRRSALRLLQPDRGGQEVGANSECPRADEGRSTAADGAGLASGQSRDARLRGPQPRMPTRSEWRFAMNSGATPRRFRGREGACGSPES